MILTSFTVEKLRSIHTSGLLKVMTFLQLSLIEYGLYGPHVHSAICTLSHVERLPDVAGSFFNVTFLEYVRA